MTKLQKIPSSDYKKILDNMPVACVDLLIYNDNKVLLVLRKDDPAKGEWFVPGGRIFKNEKLEYGAIRKAREEVGLDITLEKQIGCFDLFFDKGVFDNIKDGVHTISVVYLCSLKDTKQKIKIDNTSLDARWFDLKNKKELEKTHPYVQKLIDAAQL